jgi:mRNA interferase RelE/StbE
VTVKYRLIITKRFRRDLKRLEPKTHDEILFYLKKLEENPFSTALDIRKLLGVKIGRWRLRIGDYRIRYDIEGEDIIPHVIRHRKEVYRRKK